MKFGSTLGCHQIQERSFFYKTFQFPVCARCTGVLVSTAIAVPIFFVYRISLYIAAIMSLIMFVDWYIQYAGIKQSTNLRRFLTGIIGGFGWSTIHLYVYLFVLNLINKFISTWFVDAEHPVPIMCYMTLLMSHQKTGWIIYFESLHILIQL